MDTGLFERSGNRMRNELWRDHLTFEVPSGAYREGELGQRHKQASSAVLKPKKGRNVQGEKNM